jgi:hypothetical protein
MATRIFGQAVLRNHGIPTAYWGKPRISGQAALRL